MIWLCPVHGEKAAKYREFQDVHKIPHLFRNRTINSHRISHLNPPVRPKTAVHIFTNKCFKKHF